MRQFKWLMFICVLSFFVGCSAVGKMPTAIDLKIRDLQPPEGKALVYVMRPTSFGSIVKMGVTANGQYIGATGGRRYIYTVLDPGKYVFESKAENTSEVHIVLEAGKTYYFEQVVKMGILMARNELVRLDDIEGRKKLSQCSLSNDLGKQKDTGGIDER